VILFMSYKIGKEVKNVTIIGSKEIAGQVYGKGKIGRNVFWVYNHDNTPPEEKTCVNVEITGAKSREFYAKVICGKP